MIRSLEVRDLVVISRAELTPPAGLTAITGETGAGKTVLTQALGLLAGAPADASAVRAGAQHALVQATLALPEGFWDRLDDDDPARPLRDLVDDEHEVVIARRVPADGRSRALIDGQAAPREAVAALARARLRFSAQHEHRRLVGATSQLAILDAFAGAETVAAAQRLADLNRRLRATGRALQAARARQAEAARMRDELTELVRAVEAAALDPAEEHELRQERERLRHARDLVDAVAGAAEALAPTDESAGALEFTGEGVDGLRAVAPLDPELNGPLQDMLGAQAVLQEALLFLRSYLQDFDGQPDRLERIDERLAEYRRLVRRFGAPDTAALLSESEQAAGRLRQLDQGDGELTRLASDLAAERDEARGLAAALWERRREAAPRLARAVGEQLSELGMAKATLRVEVGQSDDDPPVGTCVMWLRANPGLPEAPLAATASGGELSRVLLALHVVGAARDGASWIMDEVDAGIGGVTATAVAARLRAMADGRQVIVITHLPQVAAAADAHYRLVKDVDERGVATTAIEAIAGERLVQELCRMLGAGPDDPGARRHAEELLARGRA